MLTFLLVLAQTPAALPESVTIAEALTAARVRRPQVSAVAANVASAVAGLRLAQRPPNPSADFSTVDPTQVRRVSVAQPLSWIARWPGDVAAARSALAGTRFDSAQIIAELMRDVRLAFYDALASMEQTRLITEEAQLADSVAMLGVKRAAAGDISDLERDQLAQEGVRARLAASQARGEAGAAMARLARAIGGAAARPPRPSGRLDADLDAPAPSVSMSIDDIPAVAAAQRNAESARQSLGAARWGRVPIPGLFMEHDWGSLVPGATRLGISLPIPLFSQGSEAVALATARAERAAAAAGEARLVAQERIGSAQARLTEATARARVARDTLAPRARRTREGTLQLYDAGRVSVLAVLEALRAERDANVILTTALRDYQAARAELDAALGRIP